MRPSDRLPSRRDRHRVVRGMASLAASLLVVNAAFWLWPADTLPDAPYLPPLPVADVVVLEPIAPTRQTAPSYIPPPPPPPTELPPEEVPDEVVVREVAPRLPAAPALDTRPLAPADPAGPPAPPSALPGAPPAPPGEAPRTAASARVVERPTRSPRQTRLPLPVYPDAARRDGLRARVRVRVLVAETGGVVAAEVAERFVLDRRDAPQAVASLPYGMDEAALAAARAARFTPALDGDERVRAYTFVTLSFDPPRGG